MKNIFFALVLSFIISSCAGDRAKKVDPMKRGDKSLTCNDILLEINESEFYRKQAEEKRMLGIKSIVMPLGYIDTYMSAEDAVSAANSRISYLNNIYAIKNCDGKSGNVEVMNQNRFMGTPPPNTIGMQPIINNRGGYYY